MKKFIAALHLVPGGLSLYTHEISHGVLSGYKLGRMVYRSRDTYMSDDDAFCAGYVKRANPSNADGFWVLDEVEDVVSYDSSR